MRYYLAVDIGASSGRHILGHLENGRIVLEEAYRFPNEPVTRGGHLCWDLEGLYTHVVSGLRRCAERGKVPVTLGIDTWGVDFVLLDADGRLIGDSVAYRDGRTAGMDAAVAESIPDAELYTRTGIQKQIFNTLYQLAAVRRQTPALLERAARLLMIPEYLHYRLTGEPVSEYTIATTTGLVNIRGNTWDGPLLDTLGFPRRIFGPLRRPGTPVGHLTREVQARAAFDCAVALPPSHDTACAFAAVPSADDSSVFISSGTWSLLGVETPVPIVTEAGRAANFTNEGGYTGYRCLRNIMGLWMIQSVRRETGGAAGFPALMAQAEASAYPGVVDAGDEAFLAPESMTEAVSLHCRQAGFPPPQSTGDVLRCIYNSLALCYARTVKQLEELTGRRYRRIHIIGGGCRDTFLNRLTAEACGVPVHAGPVEGTALGNLLSQMIGAGEFSGLDAARAAIRSSFDVKVFQAHPPGGPG
ncbi:MAG: rhamnulokinase [Oscillospiraceae bacterium]|nr:rhamnulokinase [Oscillospiraceae bacterium]